MDVWETIRVRCVRDREPYKRVARELGISKNTIKKYVQSQRPPQMQRSQHASRLDAHRLQIDEWLRVNPRMTAKRIGALLRERFDPDLRIGERALQRYVAARRVMLVPKEAFVRAAYAPGDQAQFDFTPVAVMIAGVALIVQLFVMRLSYSGRLFARASSRCDRPALFAGILGGLLAFGGLPREGIFDNASTAVARILRGRSREENDKFRAFCGALAFPISFAAPAKGDEKGGVEGANHYLQDNFFTPVPDFASFDDLNAALAAFCEHDMMREHSTHLESIAARFAREGSVLRPLPTVLPRACVVELVHVNKFSEITYETNRYSVPTRYAHRSAMVEVYDRRLRIVVGDSVVAEHPRAVDRNGLYLDPRHFLDLLSHKHRAAMGAAAFANGRLPQVFLDLRARYIERDRSGATKAWMKVVSLLGEHPLDAVTAAVTHAMVRGTDDPAAVMLLLHQRSEAKIENQTLDLRAFSHIPSTVAPCIDLQAYAVDQLAERAS